MMDMRSGMSPMLVTAQTIVRGPAADRMTGGAALLLGMAQAARTLLDGGITTARDLGDRGGLALRVRGTVSASRRTRTARRASPRRPPPVWRPPSTAPGWRDGG
jgi:hypothetical protein